MEYILEKLEKWSEIIDLFGIKRRKEERQIRDNRRQRSKEYQEYLLAGLKSEINKFSDFKSQIEFARSAESYNYFGLPSFIFENIHDNYKDNIHPKNLVFEFLKEFTKGADERIMRESKEAFELEMKDFNTRHNTICAYTKLETSFP